MVLGIIKIPALTANVKKPKPSEPKWLMDLKIQAYISFITHGATLA
jgi:hypothetical protein